MRWSARGVIHRNRKLMQSWPSPKAVLNPARRRAMAICPQTSVVQEIRILPDRHRRSPYRIRISWIPSYALFSPTQTAGFRSDATSDRADRLYILNGCEVMYKAKPARQCSGAGAQRRCLPSSVWNPWPTSPASQVLELSSRDSLQLRAHSAAMSARLPTS